MYLYQSGRRGHQSAWNFGFLVLTVSVIGVSEAVEGQGLGSSAAFSNRSSSFLHNLHGDWGLIVRLLPLFGLLVVPWHLASMTSRRDERSAVGIGPLGILIFLLSVS